METAASKRRKQLASIDVAAQSHAGLTRLSFPACASPVTCSCHRFQAGRSA